MSLFLDLSPLTLLTAVSFFPCLLLVLATKLVYFIPFLSLAVFKLVTIAASVCDDVGTASDSSSKYEDSTLADAGTIHRKAMSPAFYVEIINIFVYMSNWLSMPSFSCKD